MPDVVDVSLDLGVPDGQTAVAIELVVSVAADLPGLKLSVDQLRASLPFALADNPFRFLPPSHVDIQGPSGAGAELALPGFTAGGRLEVRDDELRGALAAELGVIAVSGFAILTTKNTSLLALLAAEFTPGIQLSFGFTLAGVGGLVGVSRRVDHDALNRAAASGDLANLLFPSDPMGQADHLLDVLDALFPYEPGEILVGPMVKIGWGTPTLVAGTIAVIVSSGIDLIGKLAVTLPFEQLALIKLQGTLVGWANADGFGLDVSLAGSYIIFVPVDGDVRLRVKTSGDASFAFSAGGFHPSFAPPEGMTGMKRLGTEISPGPMLHARLAFYLAVTTNSVQFGAHADVEAGIDGFGIKGHFDLDVILILDPFGFMADIDAGVSIECADFDVASIDLHGHLEGPTPWKIRGHASISVLFFDVDVDIPELTWGPEHHEGLPPARDPLGVLVSALAEPANWSETSRAIPAVVQLRPGVERDQSAVHPLAELGFRQSAVPLDTMLQRMDSVPLGTPLTLAVGTGDPAAPARLPMVAGKFPPSQFFELDDTAKKTSSGYADCDAGFDLEPSGWKRGTAEPASDEYEIRVLGVDVGHARFYGKLDAGRVFAAHDVVPFEPPPLMRVRDPGEAMVANVQDLSEAGPGLVAALHDVATKQGDAALAAAAAALGDGTGLTLHGGVGQSLLTRLAAAGNAAAPDLQVVRAWEVGG